MNSFQKLVSSLETLLNKHPEIHFIRPKSYTDLDLREAAFVLQEVAGREVVIAEDVASWLDRYQFYKLGAGRIFD